MIILADTREKKVLPFTVAGAVERIDRVTLPYGDYACRFKDGSSPPITFERKSLGDLFGTMTSGYARWKRELARAKADGVDIILLIEASLENVAAGYVHSQFSGDSMVQKMFSLMVRYRLPIAFCQNRFEASRYVVEYFSAIGREHLIIQKRNSRKLTGGQN